MLAVHLEGLFMKTPVCGVLKTISFLLNFISQPQLDTQPEEKHSKLKKNRDCSSKYR